MAHKSTTKSKKRSPCRKINEVYAEQRQLITGITSLTAGTLIAFGGLGRKYTYLILNFIKSAFQTL